jgi:hypothetical protein
MSCAVRISSRVPLYGVFRRGPGFSGSGGLEKAPGPRWHARRGDSCWGGPISEGPSLPAGDDGGVIDITPNATVIAANTATEPRGGSISGDHWWRSAGNRVSCSRLRSRLQLFEAAKGADPRHDAIGRHGNGGRAMPIDGRIAVLAVPWESDG